MPVRDQIDHWLLADTPQNPLLVVTATHTALNTLVSPDVLRNVELVELSPDGKLTIKQIRIMLTTLQTTALLPRRLLFIPDAERLLPAASNALLKILEGASAVNRFLLTTAYPGRLLATIRSRCQILRLRSSPDKGRLGGTLPFFDPRRKLVLTSDETVAIANKLQERISQGDFGISVQRALLRLRDFYKTQATGVGEKLASDALLASLVELENTKDRAYASETS